MGTDLFGEAEEWRWREVGRRRVGGEGEGLAPGVAGDRYQKPRRRVLPQPAAELARRASLAHRGSQGDLLRGQQARECDASDHEGNGQAAHAAGLERLQGIEPL